MNIEQPGATAFTELSDVPHSYTTFGGDILAVKVTEDGIEFTPNTGGGQWDKPFGSAVFTYDVDGNVETKTVGTTVLTFTYDVDGNVDVISDGTNSKTFGYDVDGNLETITYS